MTRPLLARVALEPLTEQHLDTVLAIEERVQTHPWTRGIFSDELAAPHRCYLVATAGTDATHRVIGFGGGLAVLDEAHVTTLAVDPAEQRHGVGTRLLIGLLDWMRAATGAAAATLEVRAGNHGAQRLYSQLGFAPVGLRPGYYPDGGEAAVIMWTDDLRGDAFTRRLETARARLGD